MVAMSRTAVARVLSHINKSLTSAHILGAIADVHSVLLSRPITGKLIYSFYSSYINNNNNSKHNSSISFI